MKKLDWKSVYKKYSNPSEWEVGIKDWEQRSSILLNWIAQEKTNKNVKILDCGCGIGIVGIILKVGGYENVIGIDLNKKNLDVASKFYKVYEMDCEGINFNDKFDVVLALNIIEHLNNPKKFLHNVKKILKNNGCFILSLPNEIWFGKIFGFTSKDPTHKHSWNYFQFKNFLEDNGFEIIDMKPVGRFPLLFFSHTIMILCRMKL